MTDRSPDLCGEAVGPHYVRPTRGRHAVPRTSALIRLRLPLGKALALTALPTALVLGSQRPPAGDTSATAAHSAPEEAPGGGVDCARPDNTAPPAAAPTASAARGTPSAPTSGESVKPSEHVADEETGLAPAPTASPSATAATTGLHSGGLAPGNRSVYRIAGGLRGRAPPGGQPPRLTERRPGRVYQNLPSLIAARSRHPEVIAPVHLVYGEKDWPARKAPEGIRACVIRADR